MSLVTLNGNSVLSGAITLPVDGAWHADLEVDAPTLLAGAVTLDMSDGARLLKGTVVRASDFRSRIRVEVVGGAGKLGEVLPAKPYRNVTARTVLVDSLLAGGERLSAYSDPVVLGRAISRWARPAGMLRDTLDAIVAGTPGAVWRVRADGEVWVGVPDWPLELVDYELQEDDATARTAVIATADYATLDAGISLDGRKVLSVRWTVDELGIGTEALLA